MRKPYFLFLFVLFIIWSASPSDANAQAQNPPAATGDVTGKIVNQNTGSIVLQSLEVMLHIWDEKYVELNMLHGQSQTDGAFQFTEVDLKPGQLYGVMAIFDDVIYVSDTVPAANGSNHLELTVPVYETTTDLAAVKIDQMHVLWNFASDGLETTEVYILSNTGERTVKDAVTLEDGQLATLRFPLPADADFIFFQPDTQDRFIKLPGGFADTSPLMLGQGSGQISVKYLTPFQENHIYTYTATVDILAINFLLPENTGVTLHGDGLSAPQLTNLNNDRAYLVYSFTNISAGQTVQVTFSGTPNLEVKNSTGNTAAPLALGGLLLGLAMVAAGFWWWRRPEVEGDPDEESSAGVSTSERTLDEVITEIARLDEAFEQGSLAEEEYHQERFLLRQKAKSILCKQIGQS
jgi:hypothetical protein